MVEGSHDLRWTRPTLLQTDGTQSKSPALILMPHPHPGFVFILWRYDLLLNVGCCCVQACGASR